MTQTIMTRLFAGATALLAGAMLTLAAPEAAAQKAKLVDNKLPGLFMRVAIKPGGELRKDAGGAVTSKMSAFDTYYVYGDKTQGGKRWLSVGEASTGATAGWVDADQTIPLEHLLVLCPAPRQKRDRAMFFANQKALADFAASEGRVANHKKLTQQATTDDVPRSSGVIGIEPTNVADCISAFTFMPIRKHVPGQVKGMNSVRFFETMSVPLPIKPSNEDDFRGGVVFVIDTSISMGPYIERVRQSVAKFSASVRSKPSGKNVSFGVVAYRDSEKAATVKEYVTKIAHPLQEAFQPAAFDTAVKALKESTASNEGFREDAVAGLSEALKLQGWDKFQERTIILITDAGMREETDPLSQTGLSLQAIAAEASTKNIAPYSFFLRTEAGKADHATALRQHQTITREANSGNRVLPITGGSVEEFGANLDAALARTAERLSKSMEAAQADFNQRCSNAGRLPEAEKLLCEMDERSLAMRIEWLGRKQGVSAPTVAEGWVADSALESTTPVGAPSTFMPFVLMTRAQMNDLAIALEPLGKVAAADIDNNRGKILAVFKEALVRGTTDPSTMPETCRAGPNRCDLNDGDTLKGLLPSWLTRVPLQSPLMSTTVASWINPVTRQSDIVRVRSTATALKRWIDDKDGWIKLTPNAKRDEEVYAVPWFMIP